jgi:hypothetical protein
MGRSKVLLASLVAVLFAVVAIGGAIMISRGINQAADATGSSAGRKGDPQPNTAQQQEYAKSSRGPSTSGSTTGGAVPPASR